LDEKNLIKDTKLTRSGETFYELTEGLVAENWDFYSDNFRKVYAEKYYEE